MPTPGLKARPNALLVSPLPWTRLKNDRHSAPVVVREPIARTGICCVVGYQFKDCESMLNLMLRLGYNDFKSKLGL